jgi:tripartite-type tricarboxylate transporter receptor subunit TctC
MIDGGLNVTPLHHEGVIIQYSKVEVIVMRKRLSTIIIKSTISILFLANLSIAADYPTKPITIINPSAPGGQLDIISRTFASAAEKFLGQPVVVANKPGAGNMIGGTASAQATPDGYTLTVISAGYTNGIEWEIANGRKPPFTRHDFVAFGNFIREPFLVVVPFDSPWKTLADLIRDCKAKPDYYAYSSGGMFGGTHLPAEILTRTAGVKARHVPYQGGGPALTAIVGKHVDFATQPIPTSIPLAKGNKLRVLAVQGDTRLKSIPDIPTVKELGINAEYYTWIGIGGPKKLPADIVEKLRDVTAKVAKDKSFVDTIEGLGEEIRYMNPDEVVKYWDVETEMLAKLMAELVKETAKK